MLEILSLPFEIEEGQKKQKEYLCHMLWDIFGQPIWKDFGSHFLCEIKSVDIVLKLKKEMLKNFVDLLHT
jgi:hypothetical protein